MAHRSPYKSSKRAPAVLLVPGLDGSGPDHWQSIWEQQHDSCSKVDMGRFEEPHRTTWINNLNLAIIRADRPVVLVAHSLGCLAVAWWARYAQREWVRPVLGALLVAPPEVDFFPLDERLACFAPTPADPLPFPSRLIASRDDPWIGFHTAQVLARRWGSTFVDAGECGHINADSALGEWRFGREQLNELLQHGPSKDPAAPQALGSAGQQLVPSAAATSIQPFR